MQETVQNNGLPENFSQDYASISSQEQLDFKRQNITFPPQPSQFTKIYHIYKNTTNNITKLQQKVDGLQQKILQLQRCKQNSKYDENALQVLDEEENNYSKFMINYNKKCEQREQELQSLSDIYSGLKKINTSLNIRQNQKITQLINNYIESHRKVICYTLLKDHILVLCREKHPKKRNFLVNINSLNKSVSGDSGKKEKKRSLSKSIKDHPQQPHQQKQEINYSIRMLQTNYLMYTLAGAPVLPLFEGDFTPQQLQAIKEHAQKEVNIMKVVKTPFNKKVQYVRGTYSYDEKCYVLADQTGKVSIIDNSGEATDFKMIDKDDKIVLLETRKSDVWVGTNNGVLRQYSVKDKKMKLSKIFGCFSNQAEQVSSYLLLGEPVDKVLFSIHRGLFQLNLNTYEIKQVSQLPEKVKYTVDKYLVINEQICKLAILKDKYQISRSESLNKWFHQYHPKNEQKTVLHIQEKEKEVRVAVGDDKGNVIVISI